MSAGSQAPNVEYFPKISTPPPAPKGSLGLYFDLNGILTAIDDTGHTTSAGGGGSPGGADTEIQFNDGGDFGGNAAFTFDKTGPAFGVELSGAASAAVIAAGSTGFVGIDFNSSITDGASLTASETPSGGIFIQNAPTDDSGFVILGHGPVAQSPDQQLKVDSDGVTIILSNGKNVAMFGDGVTPSSFVVGQTGDKILFFNTGAAPSPAVQQTVTGSKGGNAALASLITALTNYGLILDTTT